MVRSESTAVALGRRRRALVVGRVNVWATRLTDARLLITLMVLSAVAQPHLFAATVQVSLDSASQFYPWYAYLGEGLRAGHVPGWNSAVFSGTPFAANPLSGWTYLPAMLLFTLLPVAEAARGYLLVHAMLAGCATFALARVLGIGRPGALLAGVAFANTGLFQVQNACCFAFASVYSWLPVAILGAELAMCSSRWHVRAAWWGLAGLAVSQIFAAWLGQGAYYAVSLIGGYIAYRTLLVPPDGTAVALPARMRNFVVHGASILLLGVALDAAGLLPRLEFNSLSDLAGGYTGPDASVGGLHPKDWVLLATPGFWYAGLSVLALAGAAPWLVRGRWARPLWYFGVTSVVALLVTGTVETPVHWVLYRVLPGFASLHPHAPERVLTVAYLGPALLAGATASRLVQRRPWRHLEGAAQLRRLLRAGLLVLVVAADLTLGGAKARADYFLTDPLNGADKLTPVDLSTYYRPDAAARFLMQRLAESPSRYLGYAPELDGKPLPYSTRFMEPTTAALEVNNRALMLGLQDIQGYDASHLGRYDAFIAALNGHRQNYHDAEVFRSGLSSPLLDLLNVRYLIVPPRGLLDAFDAAALERFPNTVYEDARVRILENPSGLPRAWIVHTAAQVAPQEALAAIADGLIDARLTALVEEPVPLLESPTDPAKDQATVTIYEPDRVSLATVTDAAGLLVLSEIHYPAWKAYVDDHPVHIYAADGALRAVPLPAGEHSVELRFESATLGVGIVVSSVTAALVVSVAILSVVLSRNAPLLS